MIEILSTNPHPHWFYISAETDSGSNRSRESIRNEIVEWCGEFCAGDFSVNRDPVKMEVFSALKNPAPGFGLPATVRKTSYSPWGFLLTFELESDAAAFRLNFSGK